MDDENKTENIEGGAPEWAKNLQETLNGLPAKIKEALTPEPSPEPNPNEPQEIPVPEIPPQETPEPEPAEPPKEEPEKKEKKSFLGWLL